MIKPNDHIAAMASYALADLTAPGGKTLISLAQNESAVPPSPRAIAAAQDTLASSRLYPDPDWTELCQAIAQVHALPPQQILCGAGSMELIGCLVRCYCGPDNRVLSSEYGYAFFRTAALAVGAAYDAAAESDFTLSVDALLSVVRPETRIVFVANPGNPTGTRVARSEILRLRGGLPDKILLVIDEAYGEFADRPGEATFDLVGAGNTVVLRTLSKAYGLAGSRVGWGLFPPAVAAEVRKVLNPNNISVASQAAATAALQDQDYMRAVCSKTAAQRDSFAAHMRALDLTVPASFTNFLLIAFADSSAALRADHFLRSEGILMRSMAGYGLANCLRATIGSEADMELAANQLTLWHTKEKLQ
ncbi:histidinol-phosphate transaminase [Pelagibius sp. Alg239-R121]|uniref:pyridoxal phosphate-dependent aminotransferase n=1 Tax=Pelagibius sp. Alg239-R121 TaxID=2993448 RepID=UPI0024A64D92|nr:histidinol-phosphate transaminase [Pelagibius sp. Alg239-R121]